MLFTSKNFVISWFYIEKIFLLPKMVEGERRLAPPASYSVYDPGEVCPCKI